MYTDIDKDGRISINDMTPSEAEIIETAIARLVEQLPQQEQRRFRGLLINLDLLLQNR